MTKDCSNFFPAHEEHQKYLENHPKGYCNHKIRIKKWPNENENEIDNEKFESNDTSIPE